MAKVYHSNGTRKVYTVHVPTFSTPARTMPLWLAMLISADLGSLLTLVGTLTARVQTLVTKP